MQDYRLKITVKDWFYIVCIALIFGFLLSLIFYNLLESLKEYQTIVFCTLSALSIALFSIFFITLSNKYFLPRLRKRFWYLISLLLSFLAGFIGFSLTYLLFEVSHSHIIIMIEPYWLNIAFFIGLLTCLIGLILHQFISMKYQQEHVQLQLVKTQLETLESELNPHFLFNALNSISELIYQDQKQAENATLKLSHFLRHAITQKGLITLEEELAMLQNYLAIENIRFNDKIECNIQSKEEYNNQLLPKFSIQLLVENAIKHGFNGQTLTIDIIITQQNITVSNNGKLTKEITFGVGLNNLQQRLKLLNIGKLSFQCNDKMQFTIQRN